MKKVTMYHKFETGSGNFIFIDSVNDLKLATAKALNQDSSAKYVGICFDFNGKNPPFES